MSDERFILKIFERFLAEDSSGKQFEMLSILEKVDDGSTITARLFSEYGLYPHRYLATNGFVTRKINETTFALSETPDSEEFIVKRVKN
jgi:hypothetical protein